ncbi:MAG: hypothetical protein AB8D78_10195 [Akkermansiaceae bacterium]
MKNKSAILTLILAGLTSPVWGEIPRKAPITRYTGLWTNSPFTSKPPPPTVVSTINPLDDFVLTGIAPVPGGYRITVINRKDPTNKEVIEPGGNSDFELVSVNRNPEVSLGTTVVLAVNGKQGTVTFDRAAITLNSPPAAPQQRDEQNKNSKQAGGSREQKNNSKASQNNRENSKGTKPRIVAPNNSSNNQTRDRRRR